MALQHLHSSMQEARESYGLTRRETEIELNIGKRMLEGYEYGRAKTPIDITKSVAERFHSPELLEQAYSSFPQEWPHIPLPPRFEDSLTATSVKVVKETQEKAAIMQKLMMTMYGKVSAEDLSQCDRELIIEAIVGGAQAFRAYKKFCTLLVKNFDFGVEEINKIIAQGLGQSKPVMKAVR